MMSISHDTIERKTGLLIVLVILVVSIGGLVEIVPLFFQKNLIEPVAGLKPYEPLRLIGRDIYVREGCYNCHSQMIRPFRSETERYGPYSVAGESLYDRPFQWGSKRTGPDLARIGGRYSDEWHRQHLEEPRAVVPESNMPRYAFLDRPIIGPDVQKRMKVLKMLGDPYTDEDITKAADAVKDKTELDALVAYLQGLGTQIKAAKGQS
jgi:cytochrome c oxidase cbb3-type subunit II